MSDELRKPGRTGLTVRIASIALCAAGVVLLVLNILLDWEINIALPLVFLVLGGGFFYLAFQLRGGFKWAPWLYIPGGVMFAFGIIFLLNVITNDWKSWAYAWLFLISGAGIGLLLANRETKQSPALNLAGWGMTLVGITFFAIFGVITGGLLIQVIAPIILLVVGLSLRWMKLDTTLPRPLLQKLRQKGTPSSPSETLIEPLSSRELEVLRLIVEGSSNQQIAIKLSVSQSTVKTHINNIYGKMNVQTRVQAVNRARELEIIEL